MRDTSSRITERETTTTKLVDANRVIALWGFTEAALGGILHALKFPFTGLLIGCAAVVFITLIFQLTGSGKAILRATFIVLLVKATVNPYAQFAAYFAVGLQGLLGYLFFTTIRFKRVAALLLGIFALTFSAVQKLIFLTVVFGTSLWKSIDTFAHFVLTQIPFLKHSPSFSFSIVIISVYTGIHLLAGIIAGLKAANFPLWLEKKSKTVGRMRIDFAGGEEFFNKNRKSNRKHSLRKIPSYIIFIFLFSLMLVSYIFPQLDSNLFYYVVFTIIRSVLIMFIWFSVISPIAVKYFKRFVEKKKFKHASEINKITVLFTGFRKIINYCWKNSSSLRGRKRLVKFFSDSLALLLLADVEPD